MKRRLALVLCSAAFFAVAHAQAPQKATAAPSSGQKAFAQLKSLVGSWRGTIMNIPIAFTIRATSNGTTIMHEMHADGGPTPNHEITMFYMDGDRLAATHFCDAGNRSRLDGTMSSDGTLEFSFVDVAGSVRGGYIKGMTFRIVDPDHHAIEALFITPDGQSVPLRGDLQREK